MSERPNFYDVVRLDGRRDGKQMAANVQIISEAR
jgi:hypothetical protein